MNRHIAALLVLGLPLVGAGAALAQDAIVPDQFATISAAVAGATDVNGDGFVQILVRSGTYNENVSTSRSNLGLTGENAATTILQGTGGNDALQIRDADNVRIASMTVVGVAGGLSDDAIDFDRVTNCQVLNVITQGGDTGIDVSDSQDCRIDRADVSGALTEGVKVHRSSRVDVIRSTSRDNGHQGFDADESDNVRMGLNSATGNGDSGFRDRFGSGNLYARNTSTGNVDNGWRIENSNNTVLRENTATGNFSNGLRMEETSNSDIFGNVFDNNNEWGIRRKDWLNDDFAAVAGIQDPPGDNSANGNGNGPVRNDD